MNRKATCKLLQANKKLYRHSRGVEITAFILARKYGADEKKAALAGLLHDYGKLYNQKMLYQLARKKNISIDPITFYEPALLHAPVGAWLLENELGLKDREVLDAVRFHTTGNGQMTILSRIVYLADFIEPGRLFAGVRNIRSMALKMGQLERALLAAAESTIYNVLQKGRLLHGASIEFRNNMLLSLQEEKLEDEYEEG